MPVVLLPAICTAEPAPHPDVVVRYEQDATAATVELTDGTLRIMPCEKNMIRITFSAVSPIVDRENPALSKSGCVAAPFTVTESDTRVDVLAPSIRISVDRNSGAVSFADPTGNSLLSESHWPFPRKIVSAVDGDETASRVSTWFALTPDERLYGLGQHQNGDLNQRNHEIEL